MHNNYIEEGMRRYIMDNQLFEQAKSDDILSKELISFLLETM